MKNYTIIYIDQKRKIWVRGTTNEIRVAYEWFSQIKLKQKETKYIINNKLGYSTAKEGYIKIEMK